MERVDGFTMETLAPRYSEIMHHTVLSDTTEIQLTNRIKHTRLYLLFMYYYQEIKKKFSIGFNNC